MSFLILQTINGLCFASLLFMVAIGFSLIYGLMKILNVAHATFYVLGAFVGLTIMNATGNFLLAALGGGLAPAILGVVLERGLLRRFHGMEEKQFLLTLPLWLLLDDVWLVIWGGNPFRMPAPIQGPMSLLGVTFPAYRGFTVLMGIAVGIGMWLLIERTKVGALIRAGADHEDIARAMGIDVNRVFILAFALGSFLVGMAGVLGGPTMGVEVTLSKIILPFTFVVAIVGGLGSLKGAAAGAIFVGLVDNFGKALFPELSYFTLFLVVALLLAFRPQGLFGRA